MKEKVFCPSQKSENVIIEYTDDFILDKKSKIYVPNQYKAIVFDNEKIAFRVDSTAEKIIYKECGKEFLRASLNPIISFACDNRRVLM